MKIKMLTERKIIDVSQGYLRGSVPRIEVDVCLDCGAVVFDVVRHDKWHTQSSVLEQTPADCNCGFGGEHLDNNPRCRANAEQTPEGSGR